MLELLLVLHSWQTILQENSLPSISSLLGEAPCKPLTWKRSVKLILRSNLYNDFLKKCSCLPVVKCDKEYYLAGHCLKHWSVSRGNRTMTRSTNFRVWLLVGCHGLESDVCRFRTRKRDGDLQHYAVIFLTELRSYHTYGITYK